MRKLSLLFLLTLPVAGFSQTPAPAPLLVSPKVAYDEAMHPLELTRHSISNWSDTEVGALTVAVGQAAKACAERDPKAFVGADLIDLARLCALGQNFASVVEITSRYIAADGAKPQLTSAYAGLVDAQLHLRDEPAAFASAQAMLAAVPYDTLTADTITEALAFLQFVYTDDALKLSAAREVFVLKLIAAARAAPDPSTAAPQPETAATQLYPGAEAPQSLHELYADGIAFAALEQLSKVPQNEVARTVSALDSALPATLVPDESIPVGMIRRRYALLGQPLPDLAHPAHPTNPAHPAVFATLDIPPQLPQIPANHAVTALMLFPDWCVQCIRMATKFPASVFTVAGHEAYLYGLLAETAPPNPKPKKGSAQTAAFAPGDAANDLAGTPTLVVDPSLLDVFSATDVPLLILTDSQGIVRVIQPVDDDALAPGGTVDSAIARVGAGWPVSRSVQPAPPNPPRPPTP